MADDKLPKRAAYLREQGRRRRGRPRLRWEDCVERCEEGRREGRLEEEDKRLRRVEKTMSLLYEAVKKLRAAPHS